MGYWASAACRTPALQGRLDALTFLVRCRGRGRCRHRTRHRACGTHPSSPTCARSTASGEVEVLVESAEATRTVNEVQFQDPVAGPAGPVRPPQGAVVLRRDAGLRPGSAVRLGNSPTRCPVCQMPTGFLREAFTSAYSRRPVMPGSVAKAARPPSKIRGRSSSSRCLCGSPPKTRQGLREGAHPRGCGERYISTLVVSPWSGSSPRVRGAVCVSCTFIKGRRLFQQG